jgi:hemoglobin
MGKAFQERWALGLGALVLVSWVVAASAQENRAPGASASEGDRRWYDGLRDVINRGADLYNGGDQNGCYRLFQGALMALRLHFAGRHDIERAIETGLADAERQRSVQEKAYALRRALDTVRAQLKPQAARSGEDRKISGAEEKTPAGRRPTDDSSAKPREAVPKSSGSLWERLGGEKAMKKVVDDFTNLAAGDPKVNFDRNGRYKLDAAAVIHFKREMIDLISQVSGGPFPYTGKSMKDVHKGMGITDAEFDALATDLRKVLENNGVQPADIDELLKIVAGTRKDIVEEAKPDVQKPGDKKPEDKKSTNPETNKRPEGG